MQESFSRLEFTSSESSKVLAPLKCSKGGEAKLLCRNQVHTRNTGLFHKSLQGRIKRLEFFMENSRSCEDRRIQNSCRVDKGWTNPSLGFQDPMWTIDHDSGSVKIILENRSS
jgi:hypothetical protein